IPGSLSREPLGYGTASVESGWVSSLEKGADFSTVVVTIMKASEVAGFLENYLPDYAAQPEDFRPLPKLAMTYYLFRSTFVPLFIVAGIAWFFPQFIWVAILLVFGSLGLGFLRYKD